MDPPNHFNLTSKADSATLPELNTNSHSRFNPTIPSPVERFKANMDAISDLIHELVTKANQRGCTIVSSLTVSLGTIYLKSQNPDQLIISFIDRSHEYWDKIHIQDENFFNENLGTVFSGISKASSDAFVILATAKDNTGNPIISKNDREDIWNYMKSFVKISIHYIHEKRMPDLMDKGGKPIAVYRQNFKPEIKLEDHGEKWKIRFVFKRRK